MPTYDIACEAGHESEVIRHWSDRHTPCPICGAPTVRVWKSRAPGTIDDTLPGGPRFIENLGHEPVYVETTTQLKRECKARGLEPFVRHQGGPHGDKSRHTTRWI